MSMQTICSTSFNLSKPSDTASLSAFSTSIPLLQTSPLKHSPITLSNDQIPSLHPRPAMPNSADMANQTPGINQGSGDWLFLMIEKVSKCVTLGEAIRLVFQSECLKTTLEKQR